MARRAADKARVDHHQVVTLPPHSLHLEALFRLEDQTAVPRPVLEKLSDFGGDVVSPLAFKKGNLQTTSRPESGGCRVDALLAGTNFGPVLGGRTDPAVNKRFGPSLDGRFVEMREADLFVDTLGALHVNE